MDITRRQEWPSSAWATSALPLAVEFGKHRPVLGFDINKARIEELRGGK